MTINLPEDLESSIRAEVLSGRFPSVDDAIAAAWRAFLRQSSQGRTGPQEPAEGVAPAHRPIWEEIQDISRSVPPEVWDTLPTDLSAQHDHYIYGTPKRNDA